MKTATAAQLLACIAVLSFSCVAVLTLAGVAVLPCACAPDAPDYERVGKAHTSYFSDWYRIDVAIVVPPGQSEEKLRKTIDRAIAELRESYEADIVLLRIYDAREKASDHGWSVGKAIYGPNGSFFGEPGQPFMTKVEFGPSETEILQRQEAEWQRAAEKLGAAASDDSAGTR